MTTPTTEPTALSRKLTELSEHRRTALHELKSLRDRQEHVPLASIPGLGSALRVLKRSYLLPQIQAWQQAINQLSLEETETLALAFAGLDHHLNQINDAVIGLQQNQDSLGTFVNQIGVALTALQESHANLGTHVTQVNTALTDLQHTSHQLRTQVTHVSEVVSRLQALPERVAVESGRVDRLDAQVSYLPGSVNELVAGLRRQIEQVAADSRAALAQAQSTLNRIESNHVD
ncbi:MAG: hypothetical protein ACYDBJ_10430 [Aggregatilineales bacterium]